MSVREVTSWVYEYGCQLAKAVNASALLLYSDALEKNESLRELVSQTSAQVILVDRGERPT